MEALNIPSSSSRRLSSISARSRRSRRSSKQAWDIFDDDDKHFAKPLSKREQKAVAYLTRLKGKKKVSKVTESYYKNHTFRPNLSSKSRSMARDRGRWAERREKYVEAFHKRRNDAKTKQDDLPSDYTLRPQISAGSKKLMQDRSKFHERYESTLKSWLKKRGGKADAKGKLSSKELAKLSNMPLTGAEERFLRRNFFHKKDKKKTVAHYDRECTFKPKLNSTCGSGSGSGAFSRRKFLDRMRKDIKSRDHKKWRHATKVVLSSAAEAKIRKLTQELQTAKCQHKFERCIRIEQEIEQIEQDALRISMLEAKARRDELAKTQPKKADSKTRQTNALLARLQRELKTAMGHDDFELCIYLRSKIHALKNGREMTTKPFKRGAFASRTTTAGGKKKGKGRASVYSRMSQDVARRKEKKEKLDDVLRRPMKIKKRTLGTKTSSRSSAIGKKKSMTVVCPGPPSPTTAGDSLTSGTPKSATVPTTRRNKRDTSSEKRTKNFSVSSPKEAKKNETMQMMNKTKEFVVNARRRDGSGLREASSPRLTSPQLLRASLESIDELTDEQDTARYAANFDDDGTSIHDFSSASASTDQDDFLSRHDDAFSSKSSKSHNHMLDYTYGLAVAGEDASSIGGSDFSRMQHHASHTSFEEDEF